MSHPTTLAMFCKVVDNYGDIGICWRFCKQLAAEYGVAPTLWVDDLHSFKKICPSVELVPSQAIDGVTVRHWAEPISGFEVADIVVEFFAVDIPANYVEAMAQREKKPVWINYEGLSAEEWVEGCHALPSMHPRLPLTKYFFFPGFTGKTGGLLRERLDVEPFQLDQGVLNVSLFCYPHAPVVELLEQLRGGSEPVVCHVPEGVAADAVAPFVGTQGALTVKVVPFMSQPDYDRLLWACDVNFVRGEDSFVRAQWAGKPFVWHIYPQDEQLHHKKLRAFLGKYAPALPALGEFSRAWNGASAQPLDWPALRAELPAISARARAWDAEMRALGDFAGNLLAFARSHM